MDFPVADDNGCSSSTRQEQPLSITLLPIPHMRETSPGFLALEELLLFVSSRCDMVERARTFDS